MTAMAGRQADAATPDGAPACPWLARYPAHVDWHQGFAAAPVHKILDNAVAAYGTRVCTRFLGRTLTYRELGALVDCTAAGLQALGVGKDTRVGLLMPNCPTYIVYYYATLKAGGTVVNFNPLYAHEELSAQVRDSDTSLMVTLDLAGVFSKVEPLLGEGTLERAIVASFAALLSGGKSVLFKLLRFRELARPDRSSMRHRIVRESDVLSQPWALVPPAIDPGNDIAVLQYTGGTTGTPKGAMLSHANVTANAAQSVAWAAGVVDEAQERVLAVLPLSHAFGMTAVMNFAVMVGAELMLMPRFVPSEAIELIARTRPTVMPAVPTLLAAMLACHKRAGCDLTSLKYCVCGGAPLPMEVKRAFEALTGGQVVEGYGLSEAGPVVTCNPPGAPVKPGSVGQPLPGTIVSVRDLADPSVEVAPGEKGEICVKGPQVMRGYWRRPMETAAQLVGGFLRTGDVGRMDADGFVFVEDRIEDLIVSKGYHVYPRRIEDALCEHPDVEEAAVIGVADASRGEAPKAFVKLSAGAAAGVDDLRRHLERRIAPVEMPAEIELRAVLPRTMIGRLSKKELRAEEARLRRT